MAETNRLQNFEQEENSGITGALKRESIAVDQENLEASETNSRYRKPLLSWEAPRYHKQDRPKWWYIAAISIAVGLFIYGLLANAWTLSVLVLVVVGTFYYTDHKPAPVVTIQISESGILVGKRFYPFTMFQAFWIDFAPPALDDLHFVPKNNYKYELTLLLNGQDPALIRRVLQRFVPELADREKSITESFSKIIGL